MLQIGEDVGEVASDELCDRRHRSQSAVSGPPEPAGEERVGHAAVRVVPELAEALLERPGSRHLDLRTAS